MDFNLTEEKKIKYYNYLRAINIVATGLCVPLALLYCKKFKVDTDGADGFNFIAVLYCLVVILYCEQYFFPLDFKGALRVTGFLFLNLFVGVFASSTSILYSSYQIFYTTLCMQAIFALGFALSLFIEYFYHFTFYIETKNTFLESLGMSASILLIFFPLIIAPVTMGIPVYFELSHLEAFEKWVLIGAIGWNVTYNVIRVGKILFNQNREEHKIQSKKLESWEGAINAIFFLVLLSIFGISFY